MSIPTHNQSTAKPNTKFKTPQPRIHHKLSGQDIDDEVLYKFKRKMWISSNSYVVSWMIAFIGNMFKIPDAMLDLTFLAVGGCLPGHFYYQL
ncbi:hypothetical protein Zmor_013159 [Zophobas morio]|uniref:Uncharacterized protein n=1 Tax=Zophobas morio TaxID=2755281 RepID=A0AA38IH92_9CUCU|nr:hypothetical protein Zmor_013159 [Zophobas morio]